MRLPAYLVVAVTLLASACGAKTNASETDGQTHWMQRCDDADDCGSLECVCGVCTETCTRGGACSVGAETGALCALASEVLDVAACDDRSTSTRACVPQCDRQADCLAVESDLVCSPAQGACIPEELIVVANGDDDSDASVGSAGSGGGAVSEGSGGMSSMGGAGGMAGMGMSGAGGMSGFGETQAGACVNTGEDELSCPDAVGPFTGSCAPKGACCHRASNVAKLAELESGESRVLEYRITQALAINHPRSLSLPIWRMRSAEHARSCLGDQCRLLRFTQPRAGSELVAGDATSEIGIGRYNCDGTYSFYDSTVAPERLAEGQTAPNRWATPAVTATFDPALNDLDQMRVSWAENPNRRITCMPHNLPGTHTIDWEECTTGFELLSFDTSDAGLDCQGIWTGSSWESSGRFQTYVPIVGNSVDILDAISQSYCQLLSFSVLEPEDRGIDCLAIPRCMPGSDGCKYVKLPDSLCPDNDTDREIFRCHLGAEGNPNGEAGYPADLNCTASAPTSPLDPDEDPSVSAGQCCDPLGTAESGLPACNAFRVVYEYVASAAEITDERSSEWAPVCQ